MTKFPNFSKLPNWERHESGDFEKEKGKEKGGKEKGTKEKGEKKKGQVQLRIPYAESGVLRFAQRHSLIE